MSTARPGPHNLHSLPTLTEVIEMPVAAPSAGVVEPPPYAAPAWQEEVPPAAFAVDEEQLVQRVLADLQRNADLMLEYRLRQVLTPALARLADSLVQDVREELAVTLRDVVANAVSQELARQRGR